MLAAFCILVCLPQAVNAQDDYEKWLRKDQQAFKDFQTKQDKQYAEMLRTGWIKSEPEEIPPLVSKPKPQKPVVFMPENPGNIKPEVKKIEVKLPVKAESQKEPAPAKEIKIDIASEAPSNDQFTLNVSFDFFGTPVSFLINQNSRLPVKLPVDSTSIAAYWDKISRTDYKGYISQLMQQKDKLKLNDWGYVQLADRLAHNMKLSSDNERILFVWFLMTKSGYLCKPVYGDNRIFLVCATKEQVFGTSFIRDASAEGRKLYILSGDSKDLLKLNEVYCFNGKFPGALKSFDLTVTSLPGLKASEGKRIADIRIKGETYPFNFAYNRSVINYFRSYPQTELGLYAKTLLSDMAERSLTEPLRRIIAGKTKAESLNFILHFVQAAAGYKTDQQQFDREKPMFPEEFLCYEWSDCEDRAILFSYLVRKLLNEQIVLLDYPDHIATAVRIEDEAKGAYIEIGRDKYIICDPTYIGADAGQCMPEYQNVKPGIISLN